MAGKAGIRDAGVAAALFAATMGVGMAASLLASRQGGPALPGGLTRAKSQDGAVTRDRGRGTGARSPGEIPARGWKEILWRTYAQIGEDRILALSAGVTYYMLLALFPALVAIVSTVGLFADPASINAGLTAISAILPQGTLQIVEEQVRLITARSNETLGLAFVGGLALALWSANAGIKALFDALNIVYEEDEKRGFFKLNAVSLFFTLAAVGFVALALFLIVALPPLLERTWLGGEVEAAFRWLRWPALLFTVSFGLSLIYRYGPSRASARWRWVTWGSAAAGLAWLGASALFSWYAASFGNFDATYGSLGAVIALMTWLWISFIVILLGGELNSEIEHQTEVDSTTGHAKPLGLRGAAMADAPPPPR